MICRKSWRCRWYPAGLGSTASLTSSKRPPYNRHPAYKLVQKQMRIALPSWSTSMRLCPYSALSAIAVVRTCSCENALRPAGGGWGSAQLPHYGMALVGSLDQAGPLKTEVKSAAGSADNRLVLRFVKLRNACRRHLLSQQQGKQGSMWSSLSFNVKKLTLTCAESTLKGNSVKRDRRANCLCVPILRLDPSVRSLGCACVLFD